MGSVPGAKKDVVGRVSLGLLAFPLGLKCRTAKAPRLRGVTLEEFSPAIVIGATLGDLSPATMAGHRGQRRYVHRPRSGRAGGRARSSP